MVTTTSRSSAASQARPTVSRDYRADVEKAERLLDQMLQVNDPEASGQTGKAALIPRKGWEMMVQLGYLYDWGTKVEPALKAGNYIGASRVAWGIVYAMVGKDEVLNFFTNGAEKAMDYLLRQLDLDGVVKFAAEIASAQSALDEMRWTLIWEPSHRLQIYHQARHAFQMVKNIQYSDAVQAFLRVKHPVVPDKTEEDLAAKRAAREAAQRAKKRAKSSRDADYRDKCKGANSSSAPQGSGRRGKRAVSDPRNPVNKKK